MSSSSPPEKDVEHPHKTFSYATPEQQNDNNDDGLMVVASSSSSSSAQRVVAAVATKRPKRTLETHFSNNDEPHDDDQNKKRLLLFCQLCKEVLGDEDNNGNGYTCHSCGGKGSRSCCDIHQMCRDCLCHVGFVCYTCNTCYSRYCCCSDDDNSNDNRIAQYTCDDCFETYCSNECGNMKPGPNGTRRCIRCQPELQKDLPANAFCKYCGSLSSSSSSPQSETFKSELCTKCNERVCSQCPYYTCSVCEDTAYFRCEDCGPNPDVPHCEICGMSSCLDCQCSCGNSDDDDEAVKQDLGVSLQAEAD